MDVLTRAMNLLAPSIRRWKSFHLSVPNRLQANTALSHCVSEAPLLRVFTVHVFHSMQEDVVSQPPNSLFGGSTPALETCSLKSFHLGWGHSILRNLQVIKFDGYWNGSDPSTAMILGILQACPGIRELTLRNLSDVSESRTTSSSGPHSFTPPHEDLALLLRIQSNPVRVGQDLLPCAGATRHRVFG
jgi:hypothetical protein